MERLNDSDLKKLTRIQHREKGVMRSMKEFNNAEHRIGKMCVERERSF